MLQNSNINLGELNELTNKLGMSEKDVNDIIMNDSIIKEQTYLSIGPVYCTTYYGSVSIKDF